MGYIKKDVDALISTKLTDTGRLKIARGNFNIKYFQIGDSEVVYNENDINKYKIITAKDNYQNSYNIPSKNKSGIKYPFKLREDSDLTYGLVIKEVDVDNIFNSATERGFFTEQEVKLDDDIVLSPNFILVNNDCTNQLSITEDVIDSNNNFSIEDIEIGHIIKVYVNITDLSNIPNSYEVLSYYIKQVNINGGNATITLDRDFKYCNAITNSRVLIYPKNMDELYDSQTPEPNWSEDVFNFESVCDIQQNDIKIWNISNVWSHNLAGLFDEEFKGYKQFNSYNFLSTKEYLGYNTDEGQKDNEQNYHYNSFDQKIFVSPKEQKNISILHYTNNSIDNQYGEKFALEQNDDVGSDKNFKITLPTISWHKNNIKETGLKLYVNPPSKEDELNNVHYIESNISEDMNELGLRFYNLWDDNLNLDGNPNRVGKVFPDLHMIVIDDEELSAVLNYRTNRTYTLPQPKINLISPTNFNFNSVEEDGLLNGSDDTLWVTYLIKQEDKNGELHCNYYSRKQGNDVNCPPFTTDAIIKFGDEFTFLNEIYEINEIYLLVQKTETGVLPSPSKWKMIDYTNELSNNIDEQELLEFDFLITKDMYDNAPLYRLEEHLDLVENGEDNFNFGDEFFFYGNLKTDIQATIYVMNLLCNLGENQFKMSTNPTWDGESTPYVSEINILDENRDVVLTSKIQSPQKRIGIQQYNIRYDI